MMNQKPFRGMRINKTHPLSQGLVGCWVMNEGSGNLIFDSSGNINNGINNGADWVESGVDFNGITDYINLGKNDSIGNNSEWSFVLGVKPYNVSATQCFFDRGSSLYDALFIDGSGKIKYQRRSSLSRTTINNVISNDNKYQIIITWDGIITDYTGIHIHINSIEASYAAGSNGSTISDETNSDRILGSNGSKNNFFFDGKFYYYFIYNRVISQTEINLLNKEPYAMFEPSFNSGVLYAAAVDAGIPNVGAVMMGLM